MNHSISKGKGLQPSILSDQIPPEETNTRIAASDNIKEAHLARLVQENRKQEREVKKGCDFIQNFSLGLIMKGGALQGK